MYQILCWLLAATLAVAPGIAFAQTAKSKAALTTEINGNFPDQTTGAVTPSIARSTFLDFVSSWQQFPTVNPQTGTSYAFVVGDYGKLVTFNNGSATAVTLSQATGSFNPWGAFVLNQGAGTVTITPSTSTICGGATLVLTQNQSATVISDGTNYQCIQGLSVFPTATLPVSISSAGVIACTSCTTSTNGGTITGTAPLTFSNSGAISTSFTSNTTFANWTSSTAAATASAMPSCSDVNGNHLNYVTNTGITCGTSSASAAFVLLNTLTASNSATAADTTSLTSTYSYYEIVLQNVIPATDEAMLELQVHSGGAFKTTGYLTTIILANQASVQTNSSSTTFIPLSFTTASNSSNPANSAPGVSGKVRVYTPSTSGLIMWEGQTSYNAHTGQALIETTGYWNTSAVVDGFQVLFSTGNITSGVIKVYGIQ